MRLYLVNPANPLVSTSRFGNGMLSRFRTRKPLGLLVVAGLTPPEWEVRIIDENVSRIDYATMPQPDLVGITAFTAQAHRAYQIAAMFRDRGVPVVMGGIHATMRLDEALEQVDAVVTGEAESVWPEVVSDVRGGTLRRVYAGAPTELDDAPLPRHDLLSIGYALGSIQTTRGCPLHCDFCSVTAFNGGRYRQRPIEHVVQEMRLIKERLVFIVDDNLVGTRRDHVSRAKDLFRAMIDARLGKRWVSQATINMADDEELLELAAAAGCVGVLIGFESPSAAGLMELHKPFNVQAKRDFRASVRRIQRHGILVEGSFIMGLDVDEPGIGRLIAATAEDYGLDSINVLLLTPLPGTRLWERLDAEGRIVANSFPRDWQFYTLRYPVARYKHLSWADMLHEREECARTFYTPRRIAERAFSTLWRTRRPLIAFVAMASNISYRGNYRRLRREHRAYVEHRLAHEAAATG